MDLPNPITGIPLIGKKTVPRFSQPMWIKRQTMSKNTPFYVGKWINCHFKILNHIFIEFHYYWYFVYYNIHIYTGDLFVLLESIHCIYYYMFYHECHYFNILFIKIIIISLLLHYFRYIIMINTSLLTITTSGFRI